MNRTTEYFNSVYDATFRELMRCCLCKAPLEDAHDLLQNTYAQFYRQLCRKGTDAIRDPKAYLLTVLKHEIAGYYRFRAKRREIPLETIENEPDSEGARLLVEALRSSYAYSLYGDCETNGTSARQMVLFEVLDLRAIQEDLKAGTEENVRKQNDLLSEKELVDENGQYRKEITDQAYLDALRELLQYPERYMTTVGIELELSYSEEGWRLLTNGELLYALSGCSASERGGDKG